MMSDMPRDIWAYTTQDNERLWMTPVYVEATKIEVVNGESEQYTNTEQLIKELESLKTATRSVNSTFYNAGIDKAIAKVKGE